MLAIFVIVFGIIIGIAASILAGQGAIQEKKFKLYMSIAWVIGVPSSSGLIIFGLWLLTERN